MPKKLPIIQPESITKTKSTLKSKLLLIAAWFATTISAFAASLFMYHSINQTQTTNVFRAQPLLTGGNTGNAITAYAAIPSTVSEINPTSTTADARPIAIEAYLKAYHSPMASSGEFIVKTSDKHGIDPYLVVAIAQQESNLCKIIPNDSYNCWGWGIHSEGTLRFENYEQAAQAVIRGLKEEYFDKGYDTPEKIMAKYTPQSSSWANGVNQFLTELSSGSF